MATKFNPLKFYAFNNVKVLSNPSDIVLYADGVDIRQRFQALLNNLKAGTDPNFTDLIRLITGLGFVVVPGKFGVLSEPIPLFNRSDIFQSETLQPGQTRIKLLPKEKEIVGDVIYNLFKTFEPSIINSELHQDKNFFIPDVEEFKVRVDVMANKANIFDIYKNDQFFTNGELNPSKEETSLTYAYAFESYEILGTQELILKKVELSSPNNEQFIKQANNESDFTVLEKLKNILYDGYNTADIEKEVLKFDAPQDIGIDKLYNIVSIDIPKVNFGSTLNILDYLFKLKSDVNPPSVGQTFLNIGNLFGTIPFGTYALRDLMTELSFLISIEKTNPPSKIIGYNFDLMTVELEKAQAEFLRTAKKTDVATSKGVNFKNTLDFLKNIQANQVGVISTVQTQPTPEFINKFIDNQQVAALDSYYRLFEGLYNVREVSNPDEVIRKLGLTRFNMSELYQSLLKDLSVGIFGAGIIQNAPAAFSNNDRRDALYRNSRLAGIKVVKSTNPYDPVNTAGYSDSIIQTFHVTTQQGSQDKTITLFDSQVVYGKEYYYTAFGVYEVDGKFYSYDNVTINSTAITVETGEFTETPNIVESGPSKGFFVNPCCRAIDVNGTQNLYGRQADPNLGDSSTEKARNFLDLGLSKNPNKTDLLKFVTDGIPLAIGEPAVGGINNIETIVANGSGFNTIPVDANTDPSTYPILTKLLYDLYIGIDNESYLGVPSKGSKLQKIYNSQFAYGFSSPGVVNPNPDYYTGTDAISNFLNEKRKEMFCFLCRRAGSTNPSKFPTPDRIIEETLRDIGYLSKNLKKPESRFLGGIVDCRLFGYTNPDGFPSENFKLPGQAGFEASIGSPLAAKAGGCKKKIPITISTNSFDSIEFETKEVDSKTIVEVPLDDDLASIVGRIPMPPDVTFVPLADVDNKVLIRFLESVQNDDYKEPIDSMLSFLNGSSVMKQLKYQSGSDEFVLARSQGDLQSVIMFRTDIEPNSLSDLIFNDNVKNVSIDWSISEILDSVVPNKDYWYVFATRDFTGLYSAASQVFRLKLVNDSGYTYADLEPYEFTIEDPKAPTKTFKKLIKIKPSFDETLPSNAQQVGTLKLFSTIKKGDTFGAVDAPPKFKIRVRSKKTKRAFDINLKYTQEIQQIASKKLLKVIEKNAELIDDKIDTVKSTPSKSFTITPGAPIAESALPFEPSTINGTPTPFAVPTDTDAPLEPASAFSPVTTPLPTTAVPVDSEAERPTTINPATPQQPKKQAPKPIAVIERIKPKPIPTSPEPDVERSVPQAPGTRELPDDFGF